MKKLLVLAMVVALVGAVAGCGGGSKDDCSDYIGKMCDKLASCGVLGDAGVSKAECANILKEQLFSTNDTELCKDSWEEISATPCTALN